MSDHARAVDFDLKDGSRLGDELLLRIDQMREADPIYWSETNQAWFVTGQPELMEALSGDLPFSNGRHQRAFKVMPEAERPARIPYLIETFPKWLIDLDPPAQPRLRRLMMKAFSRKVTEDVRPFARQVISEALDEAGAKGQLDFVQEIGRTIPSRVIFHTLGLEPELLARLPNWLGRVSQTLGSFNQTEALLEDTERTLLDMRSVFFAKIEERRANPTGDFISNLVTARDDGDQLSDEEMLGICYLSMLAGIDTTASTMALGVAALARHADARDYMRANPDRILENLMELQRYVSMSTMQSRVVREDFEWHGRQFKQGQLAMMVIAGANRDPRVFDRPTELDFERPQNANMTFGPGLHFCIGHLLAKMQLSEFFPEFLRRFDPELIDERLDFGTPIAFRGLASLPLRLHPRT